MVVLITNVTDAPGGKHSPRQVDIYNKALDPGAAVRIPAELVNKRVRALADQGLIAIGALPSWYTAAKSRTGKRLSDEEKRKLTVRPKTNGKKERAPLMAVTEAPKVVATEATVGLPTASFDSTIQDPVREPNRKR